MCVYDTDTIFIILALYATRIELKWNNQDEIEVQTLSFNLPVILVQVDLNFSRPTNAFPEVVWLF